MPSRELRRSDLLAGPVLLLLLSCSNDSATNPPETKPISHEWVTRVARGEPDTDLYVVYWDAGGSQFYCGGDRDYSMMSTDGKDWQLLMYDGPSRIVGYASLGAGLITVQDSGRMDCNGCPGGTYHQYAWHFAAIASGHTIAVAVGDGGHVVVHNGISQEEHETGIAADFTDVAWDDDYDAFLATASDGIVRRSADGIAWDTVSDTHAGALRALAVHGVAVIVLGANGEMLQSVDAARSWSAIPAYSNMNDVAWTGGAFTAVGDDGQVASGGPGMSWSSAATGMHTALHGVARGTKVVAVGEAGTVLVSGDGRTWEQRQPARALDFTDVIWTGSQFVASLYAVPPLMPIYLSSDGSEWAPVDSVENPWSIQGIFRIETSGTRAVASATARGDWNGAFHQHAKLYASDDLQNWRIVHEAWDSWYAGEVIYLNGEFFAETSDEMLRSTDGDTWISEPLSNYPFVETVLSITVRDNVAYGTTWGGDLYSSTDLKSMSNVGKIDLPGVKTNISWTGSEFLACGYYVSERVWWSRDGTEWHATNPDSQNDLWGIASSDKRWVVVGQSGTIRTRDR